MQLNTDGNQPVNRQRKPKRKGNNMSRMLYKYPGPHFIHRMYVDHIKVEGEQIEGKIAEGWSYTPAEAKKKYEDQREVLLKKASENVDLNEELVQEKDSENKTNSKKKSPKKGK